ncbi:MAG TPA: PPC domain-containing protein [Trichocoleus sp.]|jgi:hypothetical protein
MLSDFVAQNSRPVDRLKPQASLQYKSSEPFQNSTQTLHQRSKLQGRASANPFRFVKVERVNNSLQIQPANRNGNLGLPASVGGSLTTAANLGDLSGSTRLTWNDSIGNSSTSDFYRFTLARSSKVKLELGRLTGNADLHLINVDGKDLARSSRVNLSSESIQRRLSAGTYYMQVSTTENAPANYSLSFSGQGSTNDGGSAIETALDAGSVSRMKRTYRNQLNGLDNSDLYRINLTEAGTVNLNLNDLKDDADLSLLNADGDEVASSSNHGTEKETIRQQLNAGTYYVQVSAFGNPSTRYRLGIAADTPAGTQSGSNSSPGTPSTGGSSTTGGSLSSAEKLTSPIFSRTDQVTASDRDDLFRFDLTQAGVFSADLTGIANNATVKLIRDSNNNGTIDSGEILSSQPSSNNTAVRRFLSSGSYFLQVEGNGTQTVNYTLKGNFNSVATDSSSVIRITKTNQMNADGLMQLQVSLVKNGAVADQLSAVSGQATKQAFRTADLSKSGSMEPLPEGYWTLGDVEWASGVKGDYTKSWADSNDGLGPVWISMTPTYKTDRTAIGFHLDNNVSKGMPGTVGCVGVLNKTDLSKLVSWFDDAKSAPKLAIVDWSLGTVEV